MAELVLAIHAVVLTVGASWGCVDARTKSRHDDWAVGMVGMIMSVADADAADMMVVACLRRAGGVLKANDLRAVLAQLAVHRRLAGVQFLDPFAKRVEHRRMVTQIRSIDELDPGKEASDRIALRVNAFDQDAGEQEIRKHDDAAKAEPGGAGQC